MPITVLPNGVRWFDNHTPAEAMSAPKASPPSVPAGAMRPENSATEVRLTDVPPAASSE
jgi:hypothetical protein